MTASTKMRVGVQQATTEDAHSAPTAAERAEFKAQLAKFSARANDVKYRVQKEQKTSSTAQKTHEHAVKAQANSKAKAEERKSKEASHKDQRQIDAKPSDAVVATISQPQHLQPAPSDYQSTGVASIRQTSGPQSKATHATPEAIEKNPATAQQFQASDKQPTDFNSASNHPAQAQPSQLRSATKQNDTSEASAHDASSSDTPSSSTEAAYGSTERSSPPIGGTPISLAKSGKPAESAHPSAGRSAASQSGSVAPTEHSATASKATSSDSASAAKTKGRDHDNDVARDEGKEAVSVPVQLPLFAPDNFAVPVDQQSSSSDPLERMPIDNQPADPIGGVEVTGSANIPAAVQLEFPNAQTERITESHLGDAIASRMTEMSPLNGAFELLLPSQASIKVAYEHHPTTTTVLLDGNSKQLNSELKSNESGIAERLSMRTGKTVHVYTISAS